MPDPIDPTPAEPAIPVESPPEPAPVPEIDPGSTPDETPVIDPSPADPGDWRPRDL